MSLFNWFFGKSVPSGAFFDKDNESMVRNNRGRSQLARDKRSSSTPTRVAADPTNRSEGRKIKRHARREQLYMAVREAFTHAGVLSATYRFKVLSLDKAGEEFLVMVDVDQFFDHRAEKLADIEARIVQTAKTRYEIRVTFVYWRISTLASTCGINTASQDVVQAATVSNLGAVTPAPQKAPNFRYDPIQDAEVAAFKQALAVVSATSPALDDAADRARSTLRSYTLLTGFEDTEMSESATTPVLSATQYGDLN